MASAAVFAISPAPRSARFRLVGGSARAVAGDVDVDVDVADLVLRRPAGADRDVADSRADLLGRSGGGGGGALDPLLVIFEGHLVVGGIVVDVAGGERQ